MVKTYYVLNETTNTFQLSLIQGRLFLNFWGDGGADVDTVNGESATGIVSFAVTTNLVTKTDHGFSYG